MEIANIHKNLLSGVSQLLENEKETTSINFVFNPIFLSGSKKDIKRGIETTLFNKIHAAPKMSLESNSLKSIFCRNGL